MLAPAALQAAGKYHGEDEYEGVLPHSAEAYSAIEAEQGIEGVWNVLVHRVEADPFNLFATIMFLLAVVHTFMASKFRHWAHVLEERHQARIAEEGRTADAKPFRNAKDDTSFKAEIMHFLGEVEAIFGLWCVPLLIGIFYTYSVDEVYSFIDFKVKYTEPMFVVVIMAIASTRPVLRFSENSLRNIARLGKETPAAWWLTILIVTPILGSFITEPAAMTIAALLLARQFYELEPSPRFKYATIGLLFVNISVGGTLTHFAAPPVLMVAGAWGWDIHYMFTHFGWKAVLGILIATSTYFVFFRKELEALKVRSKERLAMSKGDGEPAHEEPVPLWVTIVTIGFMVWTVANSHHPALFIAGFLFFIAFAQATATHHDDISIKTPLLVGFFLAGLVTHGVLQQWWIAPILSELGEITLFTGATVLTAFNDNAAITFLASQVHAFDPGQPGAEALEYAVVAGAVTGGGLTVIANAPNPAGQSILSRFFLNGVSPLWLLVGALFPTMVMALCFMLVR